MRSLNLQASRRTESSSSATCLRSPKTVSWYGRSDSLCTSMRQTTFHKLRTSDSCADGLDVNITALCRSVDTQVFRDQVRWAQIHSHYRAETTMKSTLKESKSSGTSNFRNGLGIPSV